LQAGGNVHSIAQHIAILLHHIAQMDADADVDLLGFLFLCIVRSELGVDVLGALHGVDHGRELD
jgi:hypothetical protein